MQLGDTDRQVEPLFDDVGDAVAQGHVKAHPGVQRLERRPDTGQVLDAETHRGVHPQQADGFAPMGADLRLGRFQAGQQLSAALGEHLAFFGQRQPAGGAVQQPHAQPGLQLGHMARDGGLGQIQCISRRHETAGVHHLHQGAHGLKSVHCSVFRDS